MLFDDWPFHIGATKTPVNPRGIPSRFPFDFFVDQRLELLSQRPSDELRRLLEQVYSLGVSFGTPLSHAPAGLEYAEDFLSFVSDTAPSGGRGLEIGAGTGYLSKRLVELGYEMVSLEPGAGFGNNWADYGVEVIADFFPSQRALGPFDLIFVYGVLEHVEDPLAFLAEVSKHLSTEGVAFFSVPDCSDEIAEGDPSILVHEHFSYFDANSFEKIFRHAGLSAVVKPSSHGRTLFAAVEKESAPAPISVGSQTSLTSFPDRANSFVHQVRRSLLETSQSKETGIFVAGRALGMVPSGVSIRFFDDDPNLHGLYLPPYESKIENSEDLIAEPVEVLIVASITFGKKIADKLRAKGFAGEIQTLDQLVEG
jgi:2-polyprenyl-3-methyl-5-hydroxy-6-metoxy-1,4-benzoquinol methylase